MKKVILILVCFCVFATSKAQLVRSIDISAISGADTSFYLPKIETQYSYPLGVVAHFFGIAGTGGTFYFLNSPVDSLEISTPAGAFSVNSDTTFSVISDVMPFNYYGLKLIKGSCTALL